MNKLLTAITLLCFSVFANADVYFCDVLESWVGYKEYTSVDGFSDTRFIVDTERGWRFGMSPEKYHQSCSIMDSGAVQCLTRDDKFGEFISMWIDKDTTLNETGSSTEHVFTWINQSTNASRVIAASGTCTKA